MAQNYYASLHMENQGQGQGQGQVREQGQGQVEGEEEQAREEEGEQDQEHEQEQEEVQEQEQEQEGYRNREHTTCSEKTTTTTNNAVSMTDSMHSKLSSPFSSSSSPSSSSPPPTISPLSADALMKHAKSKERKGKEGKKSPSSSKSEGKAKGKAKVTATTTTTTTATVNKKKHRNNNRNINSNLVKSNFRGVSWHSQLNKWRCYVYPRPGQQKYVGVFLREEDAAKARDDMVKELNIVRDMGRLNFPNNASPSPQSSSSSSSCSSSSAAASPSSTGTSPSSTGTSSPSSGGSSPSSGASSTAQRTHRCRRKTQKSQRNTQQDQHRHVIPSPRATGNGRSFLPPPSTPPTAVPAAATTGASTAMTPNHNTSRSLNQCSDGHQMGNASSYSCGNNLPSLEFSSTDKLSDENGKPVEGGTTSNVSAGGKQPVPNHPLQNQHQHSRGHVHVPAPPYHGCHPSHHDDNKDEPYNRQAVQEDFNEATVLHSQECPIDSPGIINVNQQMSKPKKDSKQVPSQLPTSGSMPLQNQYQNQNRNQYQNQYHCNPQVIHHQNSNSNQQYNAAQRHTMLPYHVAQRAFPSESDLRFSWTQQPHFQSQSQLLRFNSQFPPSSSSSYFDNSQFLSQRQPQHQIQHQAENQPQKPCFPPLQHSVPQSALSFQRCLDKLYSGQHRRQQQQYSQHALPMSFAPLHHHDTSASTGRNDSNR